MAGDKKGVMVYLPSELEEILEKYCIANEITRKKGDDASAPSMGSGILHLLQATLLGAVPDTKPQLIAIQPVGDGDMVARLAALERSNTELRRAIYGDPGGEFSAQSDKVSSIAWHVGQLIDGANQANEEVNNHSHWTGGGTVCDWLRGLDEHVRGSHWNAEVSNKSIDTKISSLDSLADDLHFDFNQMLEWAHDIIHIEPRFAYQPREVRHKDFNQRQGKGFGDVQPRKQKGRKN